MSGVSMSTVFTMVLPAYTTADPVTSTTATVVEQALNKSKMHAIQDNLFIVFLHRLLSLLLVHGFLDLVCLCLLFGHIQWIVDLLE